MITLVRLVSKAATSSKDKERRVVLLGLDRGGKTRLFEWAQETLFHQQKRGDTDAGGGSDGDKEGAAGYTPTSGASSARGSHQRCKLSVTDLGGQPRKRKSWQDYFADADALLWVADVADDAQLARLAESAEELRAVIGSELLEECPVCVVVGCAGAISDVEDDRIDLAKECFEAVLAKERGARDTRLVFADVCDTSTHAQKTRYAEAFDWLCELFRAHSAHVAARDKLIPSLVQRSLLM